MKRPPIQLAVLALPFLLTGWWMSRVAMDSADAGALKRRVTSVGPVAYHGRIDRILRENCQTCHRIGGIAPFPLQTYEQAFSYRKLIAAAVASRRMPPWLLDPEVGEWANDRRLSEADRLALLAWVEQGAPEGKPQGDRSNAPHSTEMAEQPKEPGRPKEQEQPRVWSIGVPDTVLSLPRPIPVPARGVIPYRYAYLDTDFGEDRWIQGMQIRPTAPGVVHHVVVFLEDPLPGVEVSPSGRVPYSILRHPSFEQGRHGYFAGHLPGHPGIVYPRGMARRLPAGATLKFQLHLTPNGRATEDRTELGLVFADTPPEFIIASGAAMNMAFVIPPGAENHKVSAVHRFDQPTTLLGFLPHMHLRGNAFRYDLIHPDGRVEPLLNLPRYDFAWQEEYILKTPIHVPAGTSLRATGWFDNSADNPANPDPTKAVRFGEQTFEEMMNGYFLYLVRNEERTSSESPGLR